MTIQEQINKTERTIHTIKINLKDLRVRRWQNENYSDGDMITAFSTSIADLGIKLKTERTQLFTLIQLYYNL